MALGAILSGIGSIFGARSASRARRRADYNNSPQGIRANAEAAGFNPLVFAGPGTGTGAQYAPIAGQMIADALASFGGAFDETTQLREENTRLRQETEQLNRRATAATLNAEYGGIYEQAPNQRPSITRQGDNTTLPGDSSGGSSDSLPALNLRNAEGYSVNEAPLFRFFGRDMYGSGDFATGGTYEDALGESEVFSTLAYPLIAGDAVGHTLRTEARQYWTEHGPRPYYYGMGPMMWPASDRDEEARLTEDRRNYRRFLRYQGGRNGNPH